MCSCSATSASRRPRWRRGPCQPALRLPGGLPAGCLQALLPLLFGCWLLLLPCGARGAGAEVPAAAGATVRARDTRSLFAALNAPGVAVVELHDSIVLNRSEWGGRASVNRDVLVTASRERVAARTYVLVDFAGLDVIIGVGRGYKLTFRYVELFNHFWLVGPAFRIIRQSPGATVQMDRCIMRRRAGLPYEAAVVNQVTAERPPGFTGPQQCFQVSNFTFRTTESTEPITLDHAVRMVDYAAIVPVDSSLASQGLLYGGYLHSATNTYYIVDHIVDPACMAVRPGTDCVTLLLQQLEAQEQQAAQQQQGGGDGGGGGKGAATLAIAIAVPVAVVAAAAALASVLLLRRRRRRRRAAAASKGDLEAGPGPGAKAPGPGDTGCVFLGLDEGQALPEWSPLAHEQEAEELEVLERTYVRTHAGNNGSEAGGLDGQPPGFADEAGGDGAAASTTAGVAAASLLLRPAVTQMVEVQEGAAGASIAATSDEVTIALPTGCEGPDVTAELAGMAAGLRANVQDVAIRLEGILGTGSFGIVYKGTWQGLPVAVKTVVFSASQERRRRALQEAALCQSITHPNIIATYASELQPISSVGAGSGFSSGGGGGRGGGSSGEAPGRFVQDWRLYIVMEYADGGPLSGLYGSKELWSGPDRVNLPAILSLGLGIARALSHLHSKRIVHGDLNPNNVMLKRDPAEPSGYAVKIGDFGLSVMLPDHRTHLSNLRMGTMFYICPAVVMKGQVGPASDVFSLGVMLWELYHGRRAGIRTPEGPRYCSFFPAFPPSCPPAYKEVTLACLRKHPHKRPTAHEVEAALGALQASLESAPVRPSEEQP